MNKLYLGSLIALVFATATVNAAQQSEVHFLVTLHP